MLCEISASGGFLSTWAALTAIGVVFTGAMSAWLFYRYDGKPSYATWRQKSNPEYPEPQMVRREVLTWLKSLAVATIPPTLSLVLIGSGWSKGYCGVGEYGVGYLLLSFFIVWIGSDFVEFYYHRLGHLYRRTWREHKAHHVFHNPSPFSVIADGYVDQFMRALPLLLFPLVMPVNMDLLFFTFVAFFYGYGAYLHWGHELEWPDAHHPWINTSFQHYIHHARSTLHKPYHTGFFFKLWDQKFGSLYEDECVCSRCACERGERSLEAWNALQKPDYSVMLRPAFWLPGGAKQDRPVEA